MEGAFQLEELDGAIALLTFDVPGQKVNTFSRAVRQQIEEIVGQLETRTDLNGLLFTSGKPGQFIAGADLNELGALIDAPRETVTAELAAGHDLFDRVSRLPFPTVALIDGPCMGGGTELVLSMDCRLVSDNRKTKIALPEVKVGLIPGWGGTQRIPRLIGINAAIDMICGGDPISATRAVELGFAFDAVPADLLIDEGRRLIGIVRENDQWKTDRQTRNQPLGLSEDQANFAFAVAEGHVAGKTKGQYPAPLAALRAMREGVNLPLAEGLAVERKIAMEVTGTPISAGLISVFFMTTALARDRGVDNPDVQARTVSRVGVLGAGLMGAGIATAHARSGVATCMVDVDNDRIGAGLASAEKVVGGRIKAGRATPQDMTSMLASMSTSTSHAPFADCDVVIEAITENEEWKTAAYKQMAPHLRDDAILASNTSTISITRMAESAPHPERFAGMHFFYPVDRMQLVEVIRGEKTDDETVVTLVELARRIRNTPIVMKDCPGFLVNRILLPYMNEALLMLIEGASMDAIDKAALKFGFPMGPIALHDLVGLDTACYAGQVMVNAFKDRAVQAPLLAELVEAGRMGKKSGAGFRQFVGKKSRPQADPDFDTFLAKHRTDEREFTSEEITDRLLLPMLLEATRILEEEIVREPGNVDMGLILGIGFPPFRGGLLHWCDTEGAGALADKLAKYESLGKRFEPTNSFTQMVNNNGKFFPRG
jgi:3-hydroxyacyl-CoA dehydrogenase/enoyl-CoA hydratase/3-hydroxybutyryl-CoA epimerase/enoyl-CoA isomerase